MALSDAITAHILGSISGNRDRQASCSLDRLTDRQIEVFELIGRGESHLDIATKLRISPRTVDAHCAQIREKLALPDTPSLLRFAVRWVETRSTDLPPESSLGSQSIPSEAASTVPRSG
jgi:DNA-binding NarL/FixJ family response regulator